MSPKYLRLVYPSCLCYSSEYFETKPRYSWKSIFLLHQGIKATGCTYFLFLICAGQQILSSNSHNRDSTMCSSLANWRWKAREKGEKDKERKKKVTRRKRKTRKRRCHKGALLPRLMVLHFSWFIMFPTLYGQSSLQQHQIQTNTLIAHLFP